MRFKFSMGSFLIILGILFVGYAGILMVQNTEDEQHAKAYSEDIVEALYDKIEVNKRDDDASKDYEEVELIGEEAFLGLLEIPSLNLLLPVQEGWSYAKLKDTPCTYQTEPLIIAAHNYKAHFGDIARLQVGDQVKFVYASGQEHYFELVLTETLKETSVEEMKSDSYDLTLFTCNLQDDSERTAVRFQEISLD